MEHKFYGLLNEYYAKHPRQKPPSPEEYQRLVEEVQAAKSKDGKKTAHEYHLLRRYEVVVVGGTTYLVLKKEIGNEETDDGKFVYIPTYDQLFQKILQAHSKCGHGGINNTLKAASSYDITRPAVEIFVKCCEQCALQVIVLLSFKPSYLITQMLGFSIKLLVFSSLARGPG